ncbi:DegV family protein [Lentilactobacillus kisonensis]|uniref:EDD domain protein, DegV family n=2 Tax=Lentilactobacillus kisonensis TaxID=481722 RepID=H1LHJ7_9LACO|nr:DegV family protein [Lentilactobacillus kisonensis]EHO50323.1 EDD domain protein, DegV family [Lentilactobacillus kisonensis F0435]KRL21258.1 EDD domain protein, DegV family [Lentilactobacillus kisonensis DSM 19906 = JCM 15041]
MPEKIALLVDSASDVPPETLKKYDNIGVAPMLITMAGKEYRDNVDITPAEFYDKLDGLAELPTTSAPTQGSIQEQIDALKERGFDHFIGITISAKLSVSFSLFNQVSQENAGVEMAVINTKNIGIGSGLFAVYAEQLIDAGKSYAEIIDRLNAAVAKSRIFFYIPSLKYLRAGGRIGKVAGLVGSLLKIKPVISCDPDGVYFPITKARTEQKAILRMVNLAAEAAKEAQSVRIAVVNGADESLMQKVAEQLHHLFPYDKIYTGSVSPVLGVHTGPGLVGIAVQVGDQLN